MISAVLIEYINLTIPELLNKLNA